MDDQELLRAVHSPILGDTKELACGQAVHSAGHVCLTANDEVELSGLLKKLSGRYGRPRNLSMGGYVDPTVTERTGLPLLAPFGEGLVEMRAWAYGGRWIGCGTVRDDDGVRPARSLDLVEFNEWWARWAVVNGDSSWEPYRMYPSPGGLLQWASTEQKTSFYWLTEGPDPDRWPILVTDVGPADWDRFDCSTAEFVHRMLTDRRHPHSTARYFDTHWFESCTSCESPEPEDD